MASTDVTFAYAADIVKQDRTDDGDLLIFGKATGSDLDLDAQRCDPEWLKSAMPAWFQTAGNIREQHSSIAAGVGVELTPEGDDWYVKGLIVDEGTKRKIEKGVLKGYSVGIKNARVRTDQGGQEWICGGNIVELSVVDRPCLPTATMALAKAVNGDWELQDAPKSAVEAMHEVHAASKAVGPEVHDEQSDIDGGLAAISSICDLIISEAQELKKGRAEEATDIGILMNAVSALQCFISREAQQGSGDSPMSDDITQVSLSADSDETSETDLEKKVSAAERKEMAKTGQAMPDGSFPIADEGHLKSAIGRLGNYEGDKDEAKAHIIRRAKALGATHLLPDAWDVGGEGKSDEKNEKKDVEADLTKSVGENDTIDVQDIVKSAVMEAIKGQEEVVKSLQAEIAKMKAQPIPGGPVLIAPPKLEQPVTINKAAGYDAIADQASDPSVRAAYRALAEKVRKADK